MSQPAARSGVTAVLALACGLTVANLYYAQPLLGEIAADFRVSQGSAAFVVTATQAGYVLGLLFVLPLGDLIETRRLVGRTLVVTALALGALVVAPGYPVFLAAAVAVGLTSVVAQVLIPYAAHLADDATRGRFVGTVMTGLLVGILLARTVSSFMAALAGWRAVFVVSAALMLGLAVLLPRVLPPRAPEHRMSYPRLLGSTLSLVPELAVLRHRALAQALVFGAFSVFWSSIAFQLADRHGLGQLGIGLFALVGAAGALAAPIAGRVGDRGHGRAGRGVMLGVGVLGMVLAASAAGFGTLDLVLLAMAGILLDLAVQGHQVICQRDIYALRADARSRITTVYMSTVFTGGAMASLAAGLLHDHGGWAAETALCLTLTGAALGVWALTLRPVQPVRPGHR